MDLSDQAIAMTGEAMRYCSKCGAELADDSSFCPSCGHQAGAPVESTRRRERAEKGEKGEKHEKEEKGEKQEKGQGDTTGVFIGGSIIVLLGSLLLLQNMDYLSSGDFGAFFLTGIGAILILAGIWRYASGLGAARGFMIGGIILTALGVGDMAEFEEWSGAILLIAIGVLVVVWGISTSRRNPRPP
jgi:predicted RNA-binding Zn-ribbon protein involved in translation (DUF1610 family)